MNENNNLVVIENGQLSVYELDGKLSWEIGRLSKQNKPDIGLHSLTISRKHGKFENMDGLWFYIDYQGKNGTVYNNRKVTGGIHGRVRPLMLKDGDVFVFGGPVVSENTAWVLYSQNQMSVHWRVEDTKGLPLLSLAEGSSITTLNNPALGTVIKKQNSIAIYMGNITYLCGNISLLTN